MNANNHLLLVDDEALNRDMLSRRLEHQGFRVETAADGPAALRAVAARCPDLVLLDIMMPGMTGVEVLEELRATYAPDQLPVIMVTALKDGDCVIDTLNLGANDYITKPVDFPVAVPAFKVNWRAKPPEPRCGRAKNATGWPRAAPMRGYGTGIWRPARSITRNAGNPCSVGAKARSAATRKSGSRACTPRISRSSRKYCGPNRRAVGRRI